MSSLATYPLLEAIYTRLVAGLAPTPVYNHVPQGTSPPYVTLAEPTSAIDDTKTDDGQDHVVTVQVFSTYRGEREALLIGSAIYGLLNEQTLTLSGHDNWSLRFENQIALPEPDGLSTRVVLKFRVRTTPQ